MEGGELRHTFEEALRDGVEELLERSQTNDHPLAVRCNHIFAVGEYPVEAGAACDYVPERWTVGGDYHIVARTPREDVLGMVVLNRAIDHEVVTCSPHYVAGAVAAENYIVATTTQQVLVAAKDGRGGAAKHD